MTAKALLRLRELRLTYRALPALAVDDWSPLKNQQWACIGPNGSGKTSLARVLSGEAAHYSGEYQRSANLAADGVAYVCFEQAKTLCDRDRKLDDSETRADASDPGTLVREAILRGRPPDALFREWVQRLNIAHILERGLRYISTGEMRKTLLLRGILSRPALLILDSPMDGLDIESQRELGAAIDKLLQSEQRLLILSRQLTEIPAGVTHLLVLAEGKVLAQGERNPVLSNDRVNSLMRPAQASLGAIPPALPRPYPLPDSGPLLELHRVNVSYGENHVLRDLSWTLDRGQHCAVSGPNGCGKSTLLSLITGDNHKAYGQDITLFGVRRGSGESIWEIKQKYGQVDTQLHLNFARGMKVLEVAISGFFDSIGLYDDWGDRQRQRAVEWLQALGIGDLGRESFDALSFGMQRMVLLARAMVKSPAVLLLDEPTLGLDHYHRQLILRAVDHIAAHTDTQIIFVSHSAGDLPRCINQQLVFEPAAEGFHTRCQNSR